MPSAVSPPRLSGSKRRRPARVLFPSLVTVIALWYLLHTRERAAGLTPSQGADSTGQKRNTHSFDEGDAHEQSSLRQARTTHPRSPSPPPLSSSWALEAEQAAWRVPPKYSTHTCNGQKFYDNWHMTTCKFDNICLNASTGEFEYYVDPSAIPGGLSQGVFIDFDAVGNALIEFPDKMLNPGHSLIDSNVSWRPVVRRTRFPKLGPRVKWAPSSQALIAAMPPPLLWNFGHVMFDVLVPVFNMQQQFGLYDPSAQILIPFAVNGTESSLRYWLPTLINTKDRNKSVLHLTYHSPAAWTREYAAQVLGDKGDGLVCFHATLAGTGMLNRQQADVDALPYRQAVVRHLGIREEAPRRPVITILNKKGRRMVENFREVAKIIRTRYPHSQVNVVDFGKQPDLTMRQQVQLMADTSILISPCGGLATVLTFLRPQSTAIVLNYWNTIQQRSMQMEDNYYQHMEYLDFQYMPVNPADYEDTFDRPWCEIHENGTRLEDAHSVILGSLVHCNIHFKREGLDRLLNYVDNAMLRWAARWGRYDVLKGGTRQSHSPLTAEVVVDGTGAAGGSDALSAAAS